MRDEVIDMKELIGCEVEGYWGCEHPSSFGVIYGREGNEVLIRWSNGASFRCEAARLRNGIPGAVGIYLS